MVALWQEFCSAAATGIGNPKTHIKKERETERRESSVYERERTIVILTTLSFDRWHFVPPHLPDQLLLIFSSASGWSPSWHFLRQFRSTTALLQWIFWNQQLIRSLRSEVYPKVSWQRNIRAGPRVFTMWYHSMGRNTNRNLHVSVAHNYVW